MSLAYTEGSRLQASPAKKRKVKQGRSTAEGVTAEPSDTVKVEVLGGGPIKSEVQKALEDIRQDPAAFPKRFAPNLQEHGSLNATGDGGSLYIRGLHCVVWSTGDDTLL